VQFKATSIVFPSLALKTVNTKYLMLSHVARIEPSCTRVAVVTRLHSGKLYLMIRLATAFASPFGAAPIGGSSAYALGIAISRIRLAISKYFIADPIDKSIKCGQIPRYRAHKRGHIQPLAPYPGHCRACNGMIQFVYLPTGHLLRILNSDPNPVIVLLESVRIVAPKNKILEMRDALVPGSIGID
jgi:hypothetical protein